MPFTSDFLKCVSTSAGNLFGLARFTGINPMRELVASGLTFFACGFQANVRIYSECKPLLLPKTIFPTPILSGGSDFEIEPAAVVGCGLDLKLVEAGGIEPPSEGLPPEMTTCLAVVLVSLLEPPTAGFLGAIRFGSRPHPLRQENQPIPLNDVLSSPVGESR